MQGKIVISGDRVFLKFLDLAYFDERAREADAQVFPVTSSDDDVLRESIRDADALILIDRRLPKDLIDGMRNCRVILALEVGYDFIDVAAASARGIMVCNVPAYCTEEVALHATALIVATNRKLKESMAETANGGWDYKVCQPLSLLAGRRLGIVGLGRIGKAVVPKARGLGLQVAACDPYLSDDVFTAVGVLRERSLESLLAESDIVSLHVPLTAETEAMIADRQLGLMKSSAVLINTCRGKVVDEGALVRALRAKRLGGAGLDVLSKEPPEPDNPLLRMQNVVVTPHTAWYSEESLVRLKAQGMDEIVGVLTGQSPRFLVNPEARFSAISRDEDTT